MAIRLIDRYPSRANPATTQYPHGSGRNKSDPTADDGTPFDQDRFNDQEAFFQGLLTYAGITPSGDVDTVQASDYLDAFNSLAGARQVDSVSDLQSGSYPASLDRIWLAGWYGVGTAGGGPLYRDSADTTTADNGVTVFVDTDGVRWKRPPMNVLDLSMAGWRESNTAADNTTAWDNSITACRTEGINKLFIPEGSFDADALVVDVDRRGFVVEGAGIDASIITSKTSDVSFLWQRIDPRDRSRDKFHDWGLTRGFTIDGDIAARGSSAASKSTIMSNYAVVEHKSKGHRVCNTEMAGLVSSYRGMAEGGENTGDGVNTQQSLRFVNTTISGDDNAYTNCRPGSGRAFVVDSAVNTLDQSASSGDTTIEVASHVFEKHQRLDIGPGSGNREFRYVTGVSGSTITLDSALDNAHSAGETVQRPTISCKWNGTIELGQTLIKDVEGFVSTGGYWEESEIELRGLLKQVVIDAGHSGEANPSIDIQDVDPQSDITIRNWDGAAEIALRIANRNGSVDQRLDLTKFPNIEIDSVSRDNNSPINVNGTYSLDYIKVGRKFGTPGRYGTYFTFNGLFSEESAGTSFRPVLKFYLEPTASIDDGVTMDFQAHVRRQNGSNVTNAGIHKHIGAITLRDDGNKTPVNDSIGVANSGSTAGAAVQVEGDVANNQGELQVRPEDTATTWWLFDGTVVSLQGDL